MEKFGEKKVLVIDSFVSYRIFFSYFFFPFFMSRSSCLKMVSGFSIVIVLYLWQLGYGFQCFNEISAGFKREMKLRFYDRYYYVFLSISETVL